MTSNREVVERYIRALNEHDLDTLSALLHQDCVVRWPQSHEVIRGRAKARAMLEDWPGGSPTATLGHIVGQDEQFVAGPSWNIVHVVATGEEIVTFGTVTYPNGETWHTVGRYAMRDGLLWRGVEYYAEPFEPPEWRRPYVEIDGAE